MDINRPALINQLVEKHRYTKKAAAQLIDDFTMIILDNLREGNSVTIRNFGCFDLLKRNTRTGKHPVTGAPTYIPAHWVPRFYPAPNMKMMVKLWEDDQKRRL